MTYDEYIDYLGYEIYDILEKKDNSFLLDIIDMLDKKTLYEIVIKYVGFDNIVQSLKDDYTFESEYIDFMENDYEDYLENEKLNKADMMYKEMKESEI